MVFFLQPIITPDTIHLTIDGVERTAIAFAPSKPSAKKPPIVFMFHGHGGSAQRCIQHFGMQTRWPEAVVVYLDGLPIRTAGGDGKGWQVDATGKNRDLRFFDALLPKVLDRYHADPKEVFAWGFSNGGMFIYTLWAKRASEFAGFCTSGSCILDDDVRPTTPKPVFVTVCGNDPIVPTALQERALQDVEQIDKSSKSGREYGAGGTYYTGAKAVVAWRYNGGHEFPFESFPKVIDFFWSLCSKG